jgi:hypothetical protein
LPTIHRNTIVDLTLPWTYDHFALLIPAPDETANINAVIKPFQWPVCADESILFSKLGDHNISYSIQRFGWESAYLLHASLKF